MVWGGVGWRESEWKIKRESKGEPSPYQRAEEIAESCAVLACDARRFVDNLRVVLILYATLQVVRSKKEDKPMR